MAAELTMRQPEDTMTGDMPGIKSAPVTKKRGRPAVYASNADKAAAYRARKGIKALTVELPAELHAEFEAWIKAKGMKKSDVIAKLLRTQLLRRR